jgi:glutathione S-transferase
MTDLQLIIGNYNYSSWSLRPWFYLTQQGIEFETVRISLFTETMAEEMAPYFSDGKVPVLRHGDLEIWDSLAIIEYLAELYPAKPGWPEARSERALARSLCAEMHSSFAGLRSELPMNCRRRFPGFEPSPEAQRDIDRIFDLWRLCRQQHGASGPWLFGRFSAADAMYAPVVMRLVSYGVRDGEHVDAYIDAAYHSKAGQAWLRLAKAETEIIEEDEADWPSEPI